MKKVLVISPFFYPEPISTGKYNTYLVEQLVKQDCDVEVWCSHPIYPSWKVTPSDKQLAGVKICRGGRCNLYPKNPLLRRAVLEVWFLGFVMRKLLSSKEKFDYVIPIFPPSLAVCGLAVFKSKFGKVVGIVHDLQGVYAEKSNSLIKSIVFKVISGVEKRAFHICDHLIYLSEGMKSTANEAYTLNSDLTSVQYPFVTIQNFKNNGRLDSVFRGAQKTLVYSGALGEKQNVQGLIELFEAVKKLDPSISTFVFSQGPIFESVKKKHRNVGINFFDLVDESDLGELLVRSTLQFVPQVAGSSNGSLPSKLPNLLAAGGGVFCITDPGSELINILSAYPKGHVATDWDTDLNAKRIVEIMNEKEHVEENNELMRKFSLEGLVDKVLSIGER